VLSIDSFPTTDHVVERYLKINPDFKEDYAEFLLEKK